MRNLSTALKNLLNANVQFTMADLLEINSPVIGYARVTSNGADVTYSSNVYTAGTVVISRDKVRMRLGLELDSLDMELQHGASAVFGSSGFTWQQAALSGALDEASVKLYRAFFDASGTLVDAVLLFGGYVGTIEPKSTVMRLTVESIASKLKQKWPRNLVGSGCIWQLYGPGCNLTRPTTWDNMAVGTGSTLTTVKVTGLTDNNFTLGSLTFQTAAVPLSGLSRTIVGTSQSGADLVLTVSPALPVTPVSGNRVKLVRGCKHTVDDCYNTFNNFNNYGGMPMVPPGKIVLR